jgi:hypothetical protein
MSEQGIARFRVGESENNKSYIVVQRTVENLKILNETFLHFDLRPGITFEEANEIVRYLNSKISGIAYTS